MDKCYKNTAVLYKNTAKTIIHKPFKELCGIHRQKWGPMIYNCNFTVDQSNRELTRHGTTAFPIACYLDDLRQADAMAHILHAFQTCEQEPPYYELHVRSALSDFLALLLTHTSGVQAKANAKELRDTQRVKQMLSFIHQNYGKKLGTATIAESASVSESECLRCFRSTIGTTPIRYLREYRVEQAARLLRENKTRIGDIAYQCGFQDVSYFTKTFRELKGCTPTDFHAQIPF